MRRLCHITLLAFAACATPRSTTRVATPAAPPTTSAIVAEFEVIAARPLWPGFRPLETPLAIFDGRETVLVRHPSPPAGFVRREGEPPSWVMAGRLAEVSANSSARIGGVSTATLLSDPSSSASARTRASVAVHEAFHVFQRRQHPKWSANEAAAFLYPVEDARNLELRRVETEALRRALAASVEADVACWAAAAVAARGERYVLIGSPNAEYERKSELNEGLARYIQHRSIGEPVEVPAEDFPTEQVRARSYVSGAALGVVLDRLAPSWKDSLEARDTTALDALVAAAIARRPSLRRCALDDGERRTIADRAGVDVRDLGTRRARQRETFLARPGWTLIIESGGAPLNLASFDPLNVSLVTPREVLHTRLLELANDSSKVEMLGDVALSLAAGAHPLFNGVRTVTMTGLADAPLTRDSSGVTILTAGGMSGRFRGARVERGERLVRVTIH